MLNMFTIRGFGRFLTLTKEILTSTGLDTSRIYFSTVLFNEYAVGDVVGTVVNPDKDNATLELKVVVA